MFKDSRSSALLALLGAWLAIAAGASGQPSGACCTEGVCTIATPAACAAGGGWYLGDESECSSQTCVVLPDLSVADLTACHLPNGDVRLRFSFVYYAGTRDPAVTDFPVDITVANLSGQIRMRLIQTGTWDAAGPHTCELAVGPPPSCSGTCPDRNVHFKDVIHVGTGYCSTLTETDLEGHSTVSCTCFYTCEGVSKDLSIPPGPVEPLVITVAVNADGTVPERAGLPNAQSVELAPDAPVCPATPATTSRSAAVLACLLLCGGALVLALRVRRVRAGRAW